MTNRDQSYYTTFKTIVPIVRKLVCVFASATVQVVLPDVGTTALAQYD